MQGQQLLVWAIVLLGATTSTGCDQVPFLRTSVSAPTAPVAPPDNLPKGEDRQATAPPSTILPVSNVVNPASRGQPVAVIWATVNSTPILEREVMEIVSGSIRRPGTSPAEREKLLNTALDALIERELLYQEAMTRIKKIQKKDLMDKLKEESDKDFNRWLKNTKAHFQSDEQFKQYLEYMGTSLESQRRMRERIYVGEQFLRSNIDGPMTRAVTPDICREYYKSHPEEFVRQDSIQWQDIFILASKHSSKDAARQFAETLAAKARQGADFVQLCREFDNGLSALRQGAGLGNRRGEIKPPEVEGYLFNMTEGTVGPVVELREGFHIIRLVKREYAGPMPYNAQVEKAIHDKLEQETYIKERKHFIEEIKSRAVVVKYQRH
jgi:parvulin-like peptidyl-prolyl isomerase